MIDKPTAIDPRRYDWAINRINSALVKKPHLDKREISDHIHCYLTHLANHLENDEMNPYSRSYAAMGHRVLEGMSFGLKRDSFAYATPFSLVPDTEGTIGCYKCYTSGNRAFIEIDHYNALTKITKPAYITFDLENGTNFRNVHDLITKEMLAKDCPSELLDLPVDAFDFEDPHNERTTGYGLALSRIELWMTDHSSISSCKDRLGNWWVGDLRLGRGHGRVYLVKGVPTLVTPGLTFLGQEPMWLEDNKLSKLYAIASNVRHALMVAGYSITKYHLSPKAVSNVELALKEFAAADLLNKRIS